MNRKSSVRQSKSQKNFYSAYFQWGANYSFSLFGNAKFDRHGLFLSGIFVRLHIHFKFLCHFYEFWCIFFTLCISVIFDVLCPSKATTCFGVIDFFILSICLTPLTRLLQKCGTVSINLSVQFMPLSEFKNIVTEVYSPCIITVLVALRGIFSSGYASLRKFSNISLFINHWRFV